MAIGALDALEKKLGLRVPEDVLVAGFDDVPEASEHRTVEVTVDGVSIASPGPSAINSGAGSERHRLVMSIEDEPGVNNSLVLEWTLEVNTFGGGPTYEYRTIARLNVGQADATNVSHPGGGAGGATVATQTEANGQNGAAFFAGGKLMITKDDNAQTITMDTPLGQSVVSFVTAGQVVGNNIKGDSVYHQWVRPLPNTADGQSQVAWSGFWTAKNGTRVSGAALGDNQPGDWFDNSIGEAPWYFGAVVGTRINRLNAQTATRLLSGWSYTDASDNPRAASSDEWRFWGNTGSIAEIPLVVDLCVNRQSGQILVARVKKQTPERVTISVTEDTGNNWTEYEVDAGIGSFCSPPTLGVTPDGAFSLVFHDSTAAVYYRSETGGRTWEFLGVFIPILPWASISVPAHFQHPTGLLLVTYNVGTDLRLGLFSVPTTSIAAIDTETLATGVASPVYPALLVLPKGGVVVAWSDATTKTQQRSDNLTSYTADFTALLSSERRPRHVCHPGNGLTLHLYQEGGGGFLFYPSEDGGITVLNPPATTIFAGAADQYADIDVTPIGLLMVVWQTYDPGADNWDLTTYASDDMGSSWVAV